jgi:hypothetical protein
MSRNFWLIFCLPAGLTDTHSHYLHLIHRSAKDGIANSQVSAWPSRILWISISNFLAEKPGFSVKHYIIRAPFREKGSVPYFVPKLKLGNFVKFKSKIPDFERRKRRILTAGILIQSRSRGLVHLRRIKLEFDTEIGEISSFCSGTT